MDQGTRAAERFFHPDASINVVHPFNDMIGPEAYSEQFLAVLDASFENLYRYEYIAMGGEYEGAQWVTSTGYYVGHFNRDFLAIRATGALAYLRFGEFHRMEDGKSVESYIFLDLPELMIHTGQWPIKSSPGKDRGYTGMLTGPVSQDGLNWQQSDAPHSQSSYQMVTDMLGKLATEDEAWRPYWHDNMMWYGPAAFGSFVGLENFAGFQVNFEGAFSEWIGGSKPGSVTKHFTRFGDGNYVCSGGWPSLNCLQVKPFLDQQPTGERIYMRVCDWWRREGDLLVENWVFVDIPNVLLQLEYDVFSEIAEAA